MNLTLPNLLSLLRIVLSLPIYFLITSEDRNLVLFGTILYFAAALTDYFDGWIARKYNEVTREGKFFDPLADKVLTITVMSVLVKLQIMPLWMMLIVAGRDVSTTLLRLYGDKKGIPVKTSFSAKAKTFYQMIVISLILTLYVMNLFISSINLSYIIHHSEIIYIALLILTLLAVYTLIEYLFKAVIPTNFDSGDNKN